MPTASLQSPSARSRAPIALAVGFVIVSILKIVPRTNQLPADTPTYEDPLRFQSRGDVFAMTERHGEFGRTRHLFYLQLGEVVNGRPVITFQGSFLDPGQTLGLARSQLAIRDNGPVVPEDVGSTLLELPSYRGSHFPRRRGWSRTRSSGRHPSHQPFRTVVHEDTVIVVDEAILEAVAVPAGLAVFVTVSSLLLLLGHTAFTPLRVRGRPSREPDP